MSIFYKQARQLNHSGRSTIGFVFGLFLVSIGLILAYLSAGKMIIDYARSASWQAVPAEITRLKLDSQPGNKSTTYIIDGKYRYQFNGQEFSSTRISLSLGSDNIGDYWQQLHVNLKEQRAQGRVLALVNPANPKEAILDRTLRWSVIGFGSIFFSLLIGFGSLVIWLSLRPSKTQQQRLLDEKNGIASNEKQAGKLVLLIGLVFLLFGASFSVALLPGELKKQEYAALAILIFPLFGAAIMWFGYRKNVAYRQYGAAPLFLDPAQPGVGGEFGAWFELQSKSTSYQIDPRAEIVAMLSCIRRYRSNNKTRHSIIWQQETPMHTELRGSGLRASCKIVVPETCRPSQGSDKRESIKWELSANSQQPPSGMAKFARSWTVHLNDQPSLSSAALGLPENFLESVEASATQKASRSLTQQLAIADGERYLDILSKSGRYWMTNLLLIAFGGIFIASGLVSVIDGWWPGHLFTILGALLSLGGLFALGSSVETKIDKPARMIFVKRRWFGLVFSRAECAIFNPEQFSLKKTSSSQSDKKKTDYFGLYFDCNGKQRKIAEKIANKRTAEMLKAQLIAALF